jgi:glycine cleavage system H protein
MNLKKEEMMKKVPGELKYVSTHEWARKDNSEVATIGITDHAQDLLGDIVFIELPAIGQHVSSGDECGVVESVKAASDIYSPLSGEVIEINSDLEQTPGLVNEDPYGMGWIFKIKLKQPDEYEKLLSPDNYEKQIGEEVH